MPAIVETSVAFAAKPLSEVVVQLDGSVTSGTIDERLAKSGFLTGDLSNRQVTFDFSEAAFTELAALQAVMAAMAAARRAGARVSLHVPHLKKVRDFWRAWGFPKAVSVLLGGESFRSLVGLDDFRFFNETPEHYLGDYYPAHPGFRGDSVRSKNFFGFYTRNVEPNAGPARIAYEEKKHWSTEHIQAILQKHLGRNANYLPGRVVFEAVLNALRHPSATVLQISAYLDPRSSLFTLQFWDDGVSMVDTLGRAIDSGIAQQEPVEPDFNRRWLLVPSRDDEPESMTQTIETSQFDMATASDPRRVLFATLLPGMTCDPMGEGFAVDPEVTRHDERFGRRGMGLFVLVNAVTEVLKGSVAFRTGRYFMNVREPKPKEREGTEAQLRVRIEERADRLPPFLGNMLTIRVPVIR